ncbi:hypothetical protein [Lysobacter sp. TAB13]|uniref:hypothetical protein n=1 Tax=Lysobacter sp. TAB13 TaxID=3233065 RepID=UPI003F9CFC74
MIPVVTAARSHRTPPAILQNLGLSLLVAPFFLGALACGPVCCDVGRDSPYRV